LQILGIFFISSSISLFILDFEVSGRFSEGFGDKEISCVIISQELNYFETFQRRSRLQVHLSSVFVIFGNFCNDLAIHG
jgi:hypothetical protein